MKKDVKEQHDAPVTNEGLPAESGMRSRDIQLSHGAGNFIYLLIKATNARRILQIGTFGGSNTLWLASAATYTNGAVIALQCDPAKSDVARLNFKMAGVQKSVDLINKPVETALKGFRNPFDFMYLDAPVENYLTYFKLAYQKIKPGGVIISDRAVSHYEQLDAYLRYITQLPDLESVLAPIGKGLLVSYKMKTVQN